jgi:hypothetical protein
MKALLSAVVATAFVAASFPASSQTREVQPGTSRARREPAALPNPTLPDWLGANPVRAKP